MLRREDSEADAADAADEPESRSDPDTGRRWSDPDFNMVSKAFYDEWTEDPDDEMVKQVMGYFRDDSDEFTTR
jgi:hypothetical protein